MFNVKSMGGTFKGLVGESLFKATEKYVVLPRFFGKWKYRQVFGKYLTVEQLAFLEQYWYSLDAIKISFEKGKEIILFEVKTRNKYEHAAPFWITKFSQSSVEIYKQALLLDFKVRIATVWLHDNWEYSVEIEDFQEEGCYVDGPKKYDCLSPAGSDGKG